MLDDKSGETVTAGEKEKGVARTKSITDSQGRVQSIKLDFSVSEKLDEADENDKKREEEIDELIKPLREKSDFAKVLAYNNPKILILPALIAVAAAGFCQPLFGWVFSEFLQVLTFPVEFMKLELQMKGQDPELWKTNLKEDVIEFTLYIVYMALVIFFGYLGKSYIFSYLGENVTLKIRELLYEAIL